MERCHHCHHEWSCCCRSLPETLLAGPPRNAVLGLAAGSAEAAQPAPKNSYIATSEGYNMEASGTPCHSWCTCYACILVRSGGGALLSVADAHLFPSGECPSWRA